MTNRLTRQCTENRNRPKTRNKGKTNLKLLKNGMTCRDSILGNVAIFVVYNIVTFCHHLSPSDLSRNRIAVIQRHYFHNLHDLSFLWVNFSHWWFCPSIPETTTLRGLCHPITMRQFEPGRFQKRTTVGNTDWIALSIVHLSRIFVIIWLICFNLEFVAFVNGSPSQGEFWG